MNDDVRVERAATGKYVVVVQDMAVTDPGDFMPTEFASRAEALERARIERESLERRRQGGAVTAVAVVAGVGLAVWLASKLFGGPSRGGGV